MRSNCYRLLWVIAAFVVVLVGESSALAQARLNWVIYPKLLSIPGTAGQGFFIESDNSFEFELRIHNDEDSSRAAVLSTGFIHNVAVTLRDSSDQVVAENVGWEPEANCAGVAGCSIETRITLQPDESAVFSGRFVSKGSKLLSDGSYRLHASLESALKYVANDDGSPWRGNGLAPRSASVTLRAARSAAEQRMLSYNRANKANLRRDYESALRIYREVLVSAPNDTEATRGAGLALMELRRFAEAVTILEPLTARVPIDKPSELSTTLAIAYFAVGENAKGEALLRRVYPSNRVADEIGRAKSVAARMKEHR